VTSVTEEAPGDLQPLDSQVVDGPETDEQSALSGPHAWLNWQALRVGQQARTSSRTSTTLVQIQPLWQEFGLYSDAHIVGNLAVGPYQILHAFPAELPAPGRSRMVLVLRTRDHLLDPRVRLEDLEDQETEAYAGGDPGEQIASLLALALGRRVRSGGVTRHGL